MKKINKDHKFNITDPNKEIPVEIDYRCYISPNQALYPMTVGTSVHFETTLQKEIERHKKSYEKKYRKVVAVEIRADI